MKYIMILLATFLILGCSEKEELIDKTDIPPTIDLDESIIGYNFLLFDDTNNLNPCDKKHEIEILDNYMTPYALPITIDWGTESCEFITLTDFKVFNDPRIVEIGFRSDGMLVWRYQNIKP